MKFSLKKEIEKKKNKEKTYSSIHEKLETSKLLKKKSNFDSHQKSEISEKEKTLKLSIKEGSLTSVMSGLGGSYISLYALALKANNLQIGFLTSFSSLFAPFSQILGSRLMEKYSRKKIIILNVALQAFMWLPILLLSLFFWKNLFSSYLPIILIVFYSLYAIFGSIAAPSWFSLMGDIVPEKIRGRYFGKRNRISELVVLISTLIAAFLLDFFKTKGFLLLGFSIIFFLSFLFRMFSSFLFSKHYEPKFKLKKKYYFSIFQFIKKAPSTNFGKFAIYIALIHLAVNIAGPFFAVYMKQDLNFSYTTFTLATISASLASIIFMPIWGKFSDKYGNLKLLKIGSILIPFLPILWLFGKSPYYIALVPQLLGGMGWAAFNLASFNFIYDAVSRERRGLCIAYSNVLSGIGVFLGAGLGGLLAHYLTITFMNKLLFIFLISGILRFVIFLVFLPLIKEARKVKKLKESPVFYLKEIAPSKGVVREVYDGLTNLSKIKNFRKTKFSF